MRIKDYFIIFLYGFFTIRFSIIIEGLLKQLQGRSWMDIMDSKCPFPVRNKKSAQQKSLPLYAIRIEVKKEIKKALVRLFLTKTQNGGPDRDRTGDLLRDRQAC